MEIKDIYQKMECSKEDKEKIYQAILQKRRRNFAGSHFMKAAVIALCLLVGGTTAYAAVHLLTARNCLTRRLIPVCRRKNRIMLWQ